MASISGLSSNSATSIYGNRNIISGLASGMDTESMIKNAVSGIQARITALQQKRTKVEWQQEAYRSIISKMVGFNQKYASYASPTTNLLSVSFFNNAVKTTTNGANAGKVSATGKTNSEIVIQGVKQLATAARYSVNQNRFNGGGPVTGSGSLDLSDAARSTVSAISGSLTIDYGTKHSFTLNFEETELFTDDPAGTPDGKTAAEKLAAAINDKLSEETVVFASGAKKASDAIRVSVDDGGNITFSDKTSGGNSVNISATGDFKDIVSSGTIEAGGRDLTTTKGNLELIAGKTMSVTLDGVTKSIKLPGVDDLAGQADREGAFLSFVQGKLDSAFGSGKITVSDASRTDAAGNPVPGSDTDGKLQLSFTPAASNANLRVTSSVGKTLGLGDKGVSNFLDPSMKLGDLGLTPDAATGKYTLTVNGQDFSFDGDTAVESVLQAVNADTDAGVGATFSSLSNKFVFTAKETGSGREIRLGGSLARMGDLFGGSSYVDSPISTDGTDAVFTVSVNGAPAQELTRSSNTVDMDGMKVTLSGTFGYKQGTTDKVDADGNKIPVRNPDGTIKRDDAGNIVFEKEMVLDDAAEAVTFTSRSDADKIIDVVKTMIEDYNAMVKEIKEAYSTQPAEKNKATHTRYEPLTDADKADLSESEIKAYEEKAKQGILFAESDLSSLYDKLRSAITPPGQDRGFMRDIGLTTDYTDGLTSLSLDENKLRAALESNPDLVRDVFTKSKENGSATDGLMQSIKGTLDNYARTMGDSKGVLIEKAGSPLAPSSVLKNSLKSQMEDYDKQIERWSDKLSDQVDRYTTQFSRLEQLIAQMNSQSSMLMGLMGGAG